DHTQRGRGTCIGSAERNDRHPPRSWGEGQHHSQPSPQSLGVRVGGPSLLPQDNPYITPSPPLAVARPAEIFTRSMARSMHFVRSADSQSRSEERRVGKRAVLRYEAFKCY